MDPDSVTVDNIVLHVGDAVRWDYTRDALGGMGRTFKTIAASLHTPTSFVTMLSGQHPTTHGVYDFRHSYSGDLSGLYDKESFAIGTGFMNDWMFGTGIFESISQTPLVEMEPPFVWINRGPGGHSPYDGFTLEGAIKDKDAKGYWRSIGYDDSVMKQDYGRAIDTYIDRISGIQTTLEEMGIRDNTLIIASSDHGELLGEHGQIGHNFPASPELVYVPTSLIHPDIEPEVVTGGVGRHVDIVPTSLASMNKGQSSLFETLPGEDLINNATPEFGFNYYKRSFSDFIRAGFQMMFGSNAMRIVSKIPDLRLELQSVWDHHGGHVFNTSSYTNKLAIFLLRIFATPEGRYMIRNGSIRRSMRSLFSEYVSYGNPTMPKRDAEDLLETFTAESKEFEHEHLDETARSNLQDLGYL